MTAAAMRELEQRPDVDDERDLAVAHDGRAGDTRHGTGKSDERLDDGLRFAEELVHDEAGLLAADVDDDDALAARRDAAIGVEEVAEPYIRKVGSAEGND